MNPLTDKISTIVINDKPTPVIQPGGKLARSTNWRLTEEAFLRYKSHIEEAIRNWPNETKFDIPAGMSVNTFEHRLRDAMQALKLYGYDLELQKKLADLRTELVVSMDVSGEAVWIRQKGKKGRPVSLISSRNERRSPSVAAKVVHPSPDEATLRAFLQLSSTGHRTEPVHFKGRIDQALQDTLVNAFDTAFVYDDSDDVTIML